LRICDGYANVPVTDQYGRPGRFRVRYVDGRALVIHMMYTVCRGTCPGTVATLARLRDRLEPVFGDRMTFVSVTLDPETDTPEVLLNYARHFGAGDRRREGIDWHFLTGAPRDIDRLRRSLGFFDLDPRLDADLSQHGTLLLFGSTASDRWAALPSGLREPVLVEAIRRVAGIGFEQKYGIRA
jgi:protein SCO1/2